MSLNIPNTIVNDTAANAVPVQENFVAIQTHVNTNVIDKDGSIAMDAPLSLSATAPSNPLHAVRVQDVSANGQYGLPTGMIVDFAGTVAPAGWLLCDGAVYDDATYPDLAAVLGDAFDAGPDPQPGGTQFRVPDFRDKSSVGVSDTKTIGSTGGSPDTVVAQHTHAAGSLSASTSIDHDHGSITVTGGSHGHSDTFAVTQVRTQHTHNNGTGGGQFVITGSTGVNDFTSGTGGITLSRTEDTSVNEDAGLVSPFHDHPLSGSVSTNTSHSHTVNLPNYDVANRTGTITGDTGATGVLDSDTNYHPYVAVTKIIKI